MKKTHKIILSLPLIALLSFKDGKREIVKIKETIVASKQESFKIDVKHSKLTWVAKKVTGEHSGNISIQEGALQLENKVLKSGNFKLDTKSITVTDITDAEGNQKLLGHLKGEDFFATEKYPEANFVIVSVKSLGADKYEISGKLTIKGITNDVSFPATVKWNNNKQLQANATVKVDRTKYGIKYRSKNFFENLGDKTIYDEFDLTVSLIAHKI